MKSKLPQKLKELRNEKGLSQTKFAEAVNLSSGFVAMIESGKKSVSIETLILLADYFDCTLDYLVGRES